MRKLIFTLFLIITTVQLTLAQTDFGVKAGLNFNSDSFIRESNFSNFDSKSKVGFHAGIWARIKLPIIGYYIRPEIIYTDLRSEVTGNDNEVSDFDFQKIDVPVLFGKKIFKIAHIYAGPSFQYIIDGAFSDLETDVNGFTVGGQVGFGIELGKLGVDIRYERSLSDVKSSLASSSTINSLGIGEFVANDDFEFDTRVNQIILSISYKL